MSNSEEAKRLDAELRAARKAAKEAKSSGVPPSKIPKSESHLPYEQTKAYRDARRRGR